MTDAKPSKPIPFRETDEWFRNSLERCPLGVSVISADTSTRLFVNEACAQLFGATNRLEFTNQQIDSSFVDKADLEHVRNVLNRSDDIINLECRRYRADGSIFWISCSSSETVFDGQKAHIFWMQDISQRKLGELKTQNQLIELKHREKQQEEQAAVLAVSTKNLSIAHQQLEDMNRQKDDFLSIVAHDLRSPFTGLLGATELLAQMGDKLTPDDISDYAASLHATTKGVHSFLEALLDWADLHRGKVPFDPSPYPIQETIGACISEFDAQARSKGISLEGHCHARQKVVADKTMVERVCRKLLSNAVKYNAANGHIEIHAADDGPEVTIAIYDTGVGISDVVARDLFRLDKKTSTPGTDGEAGSGMGLILCKELIARQGGRITVFSEQGKGTTFQFWLPAE